MVGWRLNKIIKCLNRIINRSIFPFTPISNFNSFQSRIQSSNLSIHPLKAFELQCTSICGAIFPSLILFFHLECHFSICDAFSIFGAIFPHVMLIFHLWCYFSSMMLLFHLWCYFSICDAIFHLWCYFSSVMLFSIFGAIFPSVILFFHLWCYFSIFDAIFPSVILFSIYDAIFPSLNDWRKKKSHRVSTDVVAFHEDSLHRCVAH